MSPTVRSEDLRLASDTAGLQLAIRHKWVEGQIFAPERTLLLVHGATYSSVSLYDAPVRGGSFMDVLASRGFDVYALDVRGFGGSDRPAEMEKEPTGKAPLSGISTAVRDLHAAVQTVRARTGLPRLSLLGMSWGGSVAGAYAARHSDRLAKLVLIAPLWLLETPALIDPGGELGAFRRVDVRAFRNGWVGAAPEGRRQDLIPPGWFETWCDATLATDPASGAPGIIRAPFGPVQDIRDYWRSDEPFYEPADIQVPVLLIHAEWDNVVPLATAQSLFLRLTGAPYRRWVEIGEGTHMITLEKNRGQVIDAAEHFLKEDYTPAA